MNKIIINPTTEFHVLRHFSQASAEYTQTLINQEYYYWDYQNQLMKKSIISHQDIEYALDTYGSKFNGNSPDIQTPYTLLKYLSCHDKIIDSLSQIQMCKYLYVELEYPDFVGNSNLCLKSDLNHEDIKNISKVSRSKLPGEDTVIINTIEKGSYTTLTSTIGVEIVLVESLPFLWVTAFPLVKPHMSIDPDVPFWEQVVVIH